MTTRLTVGASFVGWETLEKIIKCADNPLTKLLILSLFLTGGRTNEILRLTKSNFDFKSSKHSIIMKDMHLSKKYRIAGYDYTEDNKLIRVTEKVNTIRDSFPILKLESLTEQYENAVHNLKRDTLFPGISRQNSYHYVTKAGRNANIRVSDHWFRGQRNSQLREEYLFDKDLCNTYFGWTKPASDMFSHYGSTSWHYLEVKMAQGIQIRQKADVTLSNLLHKV